MSEYRDFKDPKYKAWRFKVYKRDKFKCVLCQSKEKLNSHHIRRWADCPQLRFEPSNGVTLCKLCHDKVTGNEDEYAAIFMGIVNKYNKCLDSAVELMMRRRRIQKKDEGEVNDKV